jgi:hypothetical protein
MIPAGHVDAQSWIYFFSRTMQGIATQLNEAEKTEKFRNIAE